MGCLKPFGNLSILLAGGLLQLPTIKCPQVFEAYNNPFGDFFNLWSLFVMAELTEVMRERGDQTSIDLLNNIRVGQYSYYNRIQLQQRNL